MKKNYKKPSLDKRTTVQAIAAAPNSYIPGR
jgi:hypothetical protein